MLFLPRPLLAGLEFLNLSMLGWLAAGILPWLVHLLHRRQYDTTSWAAVALLQAAIEKQAQRLRFQHWLLLAVRTAIVVLIALSAAEPAWRHWAAGAGGRRRDHRVLLVDRSYSMRCQREGVTRFQRAQTHASRLVEDADAVTIIAWGAEVENVVGRPTPDTALALAVVEDLTPGYRCATLQSAIRVASAAIDRAEQDFPHLSQHVFFLTDLGRSTWAVEPAEQAALDALARRARLTVVDVGDDQRDNVALTKLSVEPATVLRHREVMFFATLRNFGKQQRAGVRVEFLLDGRPIASRSVDLPVGGEEVVGFPYQFIDEGAVTAEVAFPADTDCLPVDNRRWLVMNVRPQLRIACLESETRAAEDVARALSFAQGAIAPEILPINRLATLDLAAYDAVFLANAPALSPRETAGLFQYVRRGGALAVLLGEQSASSELLPVEVAAPVLGGDFRFDPLAYRHPIVQPFRGREKAGLLDVVISRYVRMRVREPAETVLAFDTGDPALVVAPQGLGRVAALALPASLAAGGRAPWSSFALSPSFLPVMRELLIHLVGNRRREQRNLHPGQPAKIVWQRRAGDQEIELISPRGKSTPLPPWGADDERLVVLAPRDPIGVYALRTGAEEVARFAVNLDADAPRSDSDLAALSTSGLPAGIAAVPPAAETLYPAEDFSLARSLSAAVVLLLFAELTLAWLLGRGWA